jgi:hypothetical protein
VSDIFYSLFAQVPWLKTFLAWTFALGIVLLVLALPAYYLFLPVFQRLRSELTAYLQRVRDQHQSQRSARKENQQLYLASYGQDHLLRHLDTTSGRLWARTKATLMESAHDIQARLASVTGSIALFTKALPEVHERLQAIIDSMPREFHLTTGDTNLPQDTGNLRVARMALTCATFFLVVIITVNTGMLSQIVRDLGFIPQNFKFLNIPLYYILALLLTCVEGGLGVIHGALSDSDTRERAKIPVGSILIALGAVGVACVEGFFYSRIIQNRTDTVTIPLINYTLPQTDLFFLWGFILVMALFGLGHICYERGARVLRGTALTSLRKQLRTFTKETARWSSTLQHAEGIATAARAAVTTGETTTATSTFPTETAERFLTELRTLLQAPPSWVRVAQQPLDVPEVQHLARHSLLWLVLAIIAMLLAGFTGVSSFGRFAADENTIALALGQAVLAATAGFLVGWSETIVQNTDWQKVTGPTWGRVTGLILAGALVLSYLLLIPTAYAAGIILLWVANLLVCLLVIAACYQLIPLLGLVSIWAQRLIHLLIALGELAYRSLLVMIWLLATLSYFVVTIFAGPLLAIKGPRASTAHVITAVHE